MFLFFQPSSIVLHETGHFPELAVPRTCVNPRHNEENQFPALHEHCTANLGLVGRYDVWLQNRTEHLRATLPCKSWAVVLLKHHCLSGGPCVKKFRKFEDSICIHGGRTVQGNECDKREPKLNLNSLYDNYDVVLSFIVALIYLRCLLIAIIAKNCQENQI